MKKSSWVWKKKKVYSNPRTLAYLTPLSTWHFDEYYKKNKFYGGVMSRDSVSPHKIKKKFYIINLDDGFGPGTHWVVLYNLRPRAIYFDSFGVYPPKELSSVSNLIFNEYRIQEFSSKKCGLYCMYFIDELQKGREFFDILLDFSPIDYNFNEAKIFKWAEKIKI